MENKKQLLHLLLVYLIWLAISVFGQSLIYLYFKQAGLNEFELVSSIVFAFAATLLVISVLNKKKTNFRNLVLYAMLAMALACTLLFFTKPSVLLFIIFNILLGSTFFLFWVPFNILYFKLSEGREAVLGTVYFSIMPLLGIVLPLASGIIIEIFGFGIVFGVTAILYALAIVSLPMISNVEYRHDLGECLKEIKGFKTLILLEGVHGGGYGAAFSVISLFFFAKPVELATFISITTVFSIIASFVVSRISDKARKRRKYLTIFGIGLGLVVAAAGFLNWISGWYFGASARNFFAALFYPFTTAIIIDNKRDLERAMVGREFVLNAGRIIGVGIVVVCSVFLSNIYLSLILLGVVIMIYPIIIELKRRHRIQVE